MPGDIRENSSRLQPKREEFSLMVPDIPDSAISFVWQIFLPYVFYYLCAFVQM
jgi:hypothetical protein